MLTFVDSIFERGFDLDPVFYNPTKTVKSDYDEETGIHTYWIPALGFTEEDISVEYDSGRITITGNIEDEKRKKLVDKKRPRIPFKKIPVAFSNAF